MEICNILSSIHIFFRLKSYIYWSIDDTRKQKKYFGHIFQFYYNTTRYFCDILNYLLAILVNYYKIIGKFFYKISEIFQFSTEPSVIMIWRLPNILQNGRTNRIKIALMVWWNGFCIVIGRLFRLILLHKCTFRVKCMEGMTERHVMVLFKRVGIPACICVFKLGEVVQWSGL